MTKKKDNECYCIPRSEWQKVKYIAYMVFGLTFTVIMAYFYESLFSPFVSLAIMAIVIAPIIEEILKTFLVIGEKNRSDIFFTLISVALGFAVGEWMFKSALSGGLILSLAPLIHLMTVLPMYLLYSKEQSGKSYIMGLAFAILIHSLYNLIVIWSWGYLG